jgi:hypothetical protein
MSKRISLTMMRPTSSRDTMVPIREVRLLAAD